MPPPNPDLAIPMTTHRRRHSGDRPARRNARGHHLQQELGHRPSVATRPRTPAPPAPPRRTRPHNRHRRHAGRFVRRLIPPMLQRHEMNRHFRPIPPMPHNDHLPADAARTCPRPEPAYPPATQETPEIGGGSFETVGQATGDAWAVDGPDEDELQRQMQALIDEAGDDLDALFQSPEEVQGAPRRPEETQAARICGGGARAAD